jgi:hypothetical protein
VRHWWLFVPKFKYRSTALVFGRTVLFKQVEHVTSARHVVPSGRVIRGMQKHAILNVTSTRLQMMYSLILCRAAMFVDFRHVSSELGSTRSVRTMWQYELRICSPNSMRNQDLARARCLLGRHWRLMSLARQSGGLGLVAEAVHQSL